jgi:magnesium transporter
MLINCVVYQEGQKLADVPVADISEWLQRPGCVVWVALKDPTDDELAQMQEEFGLHDLAVEDIRKGHQRPKLEEYGSVLFITLHLLNSDKEGLQIGDVAICVGTNFVLSVRSRSQQSFLGVRQRCEQEPELLRRGAGFIAYALMDAVVDRYFPIVEALEAELEDIEAGIFERGAAQQNIERLYTLKGKLNVIRHATVPLQEVIGKLHGGRVPPACAHADEYFRDVHDHLTRINGTVDTIRETIGTAIQVNLSMVTIEQSDVTKRLAGWAAIFAVPTAFAGIWGMNFEHMPELTWSYGYPAAIGLITGVSVWMWWRFRRSGWV